ncbi:MAG TPA: hypothetical protein VN045_07105 [Microbacteriaceae bacterium]|jgi:hypothetical protein|nr:hypothetical protein [Microbacteriaceae bacterium]
MTTSELQPLMRLEHRGRLFTVQSIDSRSWKITDDNGRNYGSVVMMNLEGEGGDPVYGGILPAEHETLYEGSDWGAIIRGIINEVDSE